MPTTHQIEDSKSLALDPLTSVGNTAGHEFCFFWKGVREAALKRSCNLADFVCQPLAAKLTKKSPKSSVTFWFTPFNEIFIVSVHSVKNIDFFDPLHSMPGYSEYGSGYLRSISRPFLHWTGSEIIRIHPIDSHPEGDELIDDFGSLFGLGTATADPDSYQEISANPSEHFDYAVVPQQSVQDGEYNGTKFKMRHVLYLRNW